MITVVIPTLPERADLLARAVASVRAQTLSADLAVEVDEHREGAAAARNRALERVATEWVAFLDDDDEFKPNHLRACLRAAALMHADVVYPGYDVVGEDPVNCFGLPFQARFLRQTNFIPVTTLCRTEAVLRVGGFQAHPDEFGNPCEDWGLWLALLDAGASFRHLPQRTWIWHIRAGTTHRHPEVNDAVG